MFIGSPLPLSSPPLLSPADTDGLVKVLSDAKTDRVLGVHIIGSVSLTITHAHTVTLATCIILCIPQNVEIFTLTVIAKII